MYLDKYAAVSNHEHIVYEFLSEGPKSNIKKVILYQEIDENVFNLAFGDWDEKLQKISDISRSNNNDRDKVLATVASTVIDFIRHYPEAAIFAKGSTPAKTRLYQMGISANWYEIDQLFEVQGFYGERWESFKQRRNYDAFLLKAK